MSCKKSPAVKSFYGSSKSEPVYSRRLAQVHAHSNIFSYTILNLAVVPKVVLTAEPDKCNWDSPGEHAHLVIAWTGWLILGRPSYGSFMRLGSWLVSTRAFKYVLLGYYSSRASCLSRHPLSIWAAILLGLHSVPRAPPERLRNYPFLATTLPSAAILTSKKQASGVGGRQLMKKCLVRSTAGLC